jgi:host factor-I protein
MPNWREGLMYRGTSECSCGQGAEEIGMDSKPAQNIQDSFLNTARKERLNITIYLLSGVKLTGRIRSFDKYSVVLETNNQEQLIFKHAISTIAMGRAIHGHTDKPTVMPSSSSTAPAVDAGTAAAAASGTEG